MVRSRTEKLVYNNMIKFQGFSEPVFLDCNLYKCFFILSFPIGEKGRLEGAGVKEVPFLQEK